ncbi:hypothetical protein DC366_08135 [Pelagivirga sediminicola]|uniref:Uncharacterized protein n=2 Tax=Pelagivirga sediminicola TaxID=2170575 RepID=A0A2T7G8Y0_9RHOB|nr:hypothetical protein DC366_08135 [Pelagivirga sediminicola]
MLTSPGAPDSSQIVILLAFVAGLLVFVEYNAASPSILEFRFAAPYNRIKFSGVAISVVMLSVIARNVSDPSSLAVLLADVGAAMRSILDFPYSPVRLVILLTPPNSAPAIAEFVGIAAALCYGISLLMVAIFVLIVRVLGWPVRRGAFNVWMNLPLFDPTGGGDVVQKLNREAGINISLGFVLPFLTPVLVSVLSWLFETGAVLDAKTLIWIICAWAFLPAGLVMRGVAMHRVAELIIAKRRRVYAKAQDALQAI